MAVQVVLEEARESYAGEIVHELHSCKPEDLEMNVGRVQAWLAQWTEDQKRRAEEGEEDDDDDVMEE